jgi:hypothetical protein
VPSNLDVIESRPDGFTTRKCRVCNRRHFELIADPGYAAKPVAQAAGGGVTVQLDAAEVAKMISAEMKRVPE